ncbi:MAG: adenosylcobinamide-GDP ribazoletransferase [Granulosicoccus sp.]
MKQFVTFGTAIMFLTRLPVGGFCSADAAVLARSSAFFPLVGALIGGILSLALVILSTVFPTSVVIALIIVLSVLLTGAFHEDGLADVFDSAGAFDRDKKLEIMRDSRVGTYGSLALILMVLVKFFSLWELLESHLSLCIATLFAAHILSRWASVWLMATCIYARAEAANKVVAEGVKSRELLLASLWTLLLLMPLAIVVSPAMWLAIPIAWLVTIICAHRFRRLLGGITGDCLGAANQLVEVSVYLFALAFFL